MRQLRLKQKRKIITMTRNKFDEYITEEYGVLPDWPWDDITGYVFRHKDNRKWFALVMEISADKLGGEKTNIWVTNVKCDPLFKAGFLSEKGVYTAYHMNKEHWLTIRLDEVSDETLKTLVSISFDLTAKRYKKKKSA